MNSGNRTNSPLNCCIMEHDILDNDLGFIGTVASRAKERQQC